MANSGRLRVSRILANKASGDSVLQVPGNKARKNAKSSRFYPCASRGSCTILSVKVPFFQGIFSKYEPSFNGIFWGHILCQYGGGGCRNRFQKLLWAVLLLSRLHFQKISVTVTVMEFGEIYVITASVAVLLCGMIILQPGNRLPKAHCH